MVPRRHARIPAADRWSGDEIPMLRNCISNRMGAWDRNPNPNLNLNLNLNLLHQVALRRVQKKTVLPPTMPPCGRPQRIIIFCLTMRTAQKSQSNRNASAPSTVETCLTFISASAPSTVKMRVPRSTHCSRGVGATHCRNLLRATVALRHLFIILASL